MKIGYPRISTEQQSLQLQRDALKKAGCAEIVGRGNAVIAAAQKRGKHIGRPRKLTPKQVAHACEVIDGGLQTSAGMTGLPRR